MQEPLRRDPVPHFVSGWSRQSRSYMRCATNDVLSLTRRRCFNSLHDLSGELRHYVQRLHVFVHLADP